WRVSTRASSTAPRTRRDSRRDSGHLLDQLARFGRRRQAELLTHVGRRFADVVREIAQRRGARQDDALTRGAIEATVDPRVDLERERGVACLVTGNASHRFADQRVARRGRLPHSNERPEHLADAPFHHVLLRDRLQISNRPHAQRGRRPLCAVTPREGAEHPRVPNLVACRPLCRTNQPARRAMGRELAAQPSESRDRSRFEIGHLREVSGDAVALAGGHLVDPTRTPPDAVRRARDERHASVLEWIARRPTVPVRWAQDGASIHREGAVISARVDRRKHARVEGEDGRWWGREAAPSAAAAGPTRAAAVAPTAAAGITGGGGALTGAAGARDGARRGERDRRGENPRERTPQSRFVHGSIQLHRLCRSAALAVPGTRQAKTFARGADAAFRLRRGSQVRLTLAHPLVEQDEG